MSNTNSKKYMLKEVENLSENICSEFNYELVDVEYVKEMGNYFLKVYIHKPEGINLDDCQKVSQILSEELDKKDLIKGNYYLEVSSPGLDRPLKNNKDYKRNLNKEIEIKLFSPLNNLKKYEGLLVDYNDENIYIISGDEKYIIPRNNISKAVLVIKF